MENNILEIMNLIVEKENFFKEMSPQEKGDCIKNFVQFLSHH